MSWDGGGTFNRTQNFSADASAGIQANASAFDDEFNNFKTGLENCLTKTGETSATSNQPMGGNRHLGVGAATSSDNYLRADQAASQVGIYLVDTGDGGDRVSASATIFPGALADGTRITVKVSGTKDSAPHAIINGLSANIYDQYGKQAAEAQLVDGHNYDLQYDSDISGFKIMNPSPNNVGVNVDANAEGGGTILGSAQVSLTVKKVGNLVTIKNNATASVSISATASTVRLVGIPGQFFPNNGGNEPCGGFIPVHDGSMIRPCAAVFTTSSAGVITLKPAEGLFSGTAVTLLPFITTYDVE